MAPINIDTSGFDNLKRKLNNLEKGHKVTFDKLFPPSFIRKYTDFPSLQEMFNASGYTIETQEDFERISDEKWDAFIHAKTRFENWQEMLNKAGLEWTARDLGFK